jgi:DNA processing protein
LNSVEGSAWHVLSGAKGVGPKTLWRIADYLAGRKKTAAWLLKNFAEKEVTMSLSKAGIILPGCEERECAELAADAVRQATVLHPLHVDFPPRLKTLKEAAPLPALLYVRGNIALLNRPGVAIVGQRRAGEAELAAAEALSGELAVQGINVVSGYANGIDSAAHLGTLRAGGTTIMVLAEGIHHFRSRPEFLDHLTVDNVLVVSQFPPDARWAGYMAMARNKLVVALSGAVVVIVSGPERAANGRMSGSFDAGISALKMGIPVFVVSPHFFTDPPEGNRQLIARGCCAWTPIAGAAPILEALRSYREQKAPEQLNLFDEKES